MNSDPHPQCSEAEFSQATTLLEQLLNSKAISRQLHQDGTARGQQVYTNAATLFALILQRLGGGLTLKQTVKRMIDDHQELMQQSNRRVQNQTLSENDSTLDQARRKIPLQRVSKFCDCIAQQLANQTTKHHQDRRVYIVDGTTISLPPTKDLAEHFPTATNQHGNSPWPIMHLLVAHEQHSSCCLTPEIGAMYGSKSSGENTLFKTLVKRMPRDCIVMADTGFGIFSTAYHCRQNGHRFVLGLTAQRAQSHLKGAQRIDRCDRYDGLTSYRYRWQPSRKEQRTHPEIAQDASLEVMIHRIEQQDGTAIYLVTDLADDGELVGALYRHRYDGEFDIRDVKVTMDTENMRARSYDTIMKELYGSVIAYNLVVQFRRQAARRRGLPPRRLSFSDIWLDFQHDLLAKSAPDLPAWQVLYDSALQSASKRVLPDRRGRRSSPRVSYRKRPKATKFEVRHPKEAANIRKDKQKRALE
ncbi:MAG: IS4 family transposase [Planctomycetota bacterium]